MNGDTETIALLPHPPWLTLAFLVLALVLPGPALARPGIPEVSFRYSPVFDGPCAEAVGKPVDPAAVEELQKRLPAFEELWRREAPRLLGSVPGITGVPFRFRETRAALILCDFPSSSLPLMINMRLYLSATSGDRAVPMVDFSNAVFHELLHRYATDCIDALPGKTTRLLEKYAAEPKVVRNHLHLYAIEMLTYRKLGREKDLEVSIGVERTLKVGKLLARAREIVAAEGPESFVRELKRR